MCDEVNGNGNVFRGSQSSRVTRVTVVEIIDAVQVGGDADSLADLMQLRESLGMNTGLRLVLDSLLQQQGNRQLVRR